MYNELLKRLREAANIEAVNHPTWNELMKEAADAIEELSLIADSNRRSMEAWAKEGET